MSEERVKDLLIEALQELGFAGEIFEKKKPPKTTPTEQHGTSFKVITLDDTDFTLHAVDVTKVFDVKEGTTNNKSWVKQSIKIKDQYGQEREMIAWGDAINIPVEPLRNRNPLVSSVILSPVLISINE